jgi:GTP-binding protein HflX
VARIHAEGELVGAEHTEDGTHLQARVWADLAGALEPYAANGGSVR